MKTFRRPKKRTIKGMGDVVEILAEPIADFLDTVLHTNIKECGGCKQRKEKLNKILPFKE